MDGSRFDDLTRTLAIGATRRRALRLLCGAAVAGLAAGAGRDAAGSVLAQADAARRRPFWNKWGPCASNQDCGMFTFCTPSGICRPTRCQIDGGIYGIGRNPANSCEFCDPPPVDPGVPDAWQPFPVGFHCTHEFEVTACVTAAGTCNASRDCLPILEPDGELCGPKQTCCRGTCCTENQCCDALGLCVECGPHCVIDRVPYFDQDGHPDGLCLLCDPFSNFSFWTGAPDAFLCGPNLNQECCAGDCLPLGEECCGAGNGNREDGTCDPEGCTIDSVPYADGAVNPDNVCQVCSVAVSTTSWSSGGFGGCGPNGDRFCGGGVCCDLGICPDLAQDVCADYCDAVCVIGDTLYYNGDRNPANGCEQCAASTSHTSWTLVAPNYFCADTQEQVCCGGTCCAAGVGCNTHEGFVCDPDLDF